MASRMTRRERKALERQLEVAARQYAVKVDGTVVTFRCPRDHRYPIDFRGMLSPEKCRESARAWMLEGIPGECPHCRLEVGVTKPVSISGRVKR